jgi:hypothetical protein
MQFSSLFVYMLNQQSKANYKIRARKNGTRQTHISKSEKQNRAVTEEIQNPVILAGETSYAE